MRRLRRWYIPACRGQPACGPHCSSSICFTGTVLTTCLPRVCFIATAVRRSHSSCYYYYYSIQLHLLANCIVVKSLHFFCWRCIWKPGAASRAADHVELGRSAAATDNERGGHLVTIDESRGSAHRGQHGRPRCHADQRQHPESGTTPGCTSFTGYSHWIITAARRERDSWHYLFMIRPRLLNREDIKVKR